jgi:hypothetical protein
METFYFYLDTKVTDWYRTEFEIKAKSADEAKKLAIKFVKDGKHHSEPWEQLDNATEIMSLGDNNGKPTQELRSDDYDEIWDNTIQ